MEMLVIGIVFLIFLCGIGRENGRSIYMPYVLEYKLTLDGTLLIGI